MESREKLVTAAADCFLRAGFSETSLDEIVIAAGVVKQTLYNHFDNKDALFREAIVLLTEQTSTEFDIQWYKLTPGDFLKKVAEEQLKQFKNSRTTDFLRLLVKECRKYPQLQEIYGHSIPEPTVKFIVAYFQKSETKEQQQSKLFHLAWCFRAALTGYATLSNLGVIVNFNFPTTDRYLKVLVQSFETLFRNSGQENADTELEASDASAIQIPDVQALTFLKATSKRNVILNAALETFSTKGFSDTSMEEIAAVGKTSKQTLYKYFKNKNILYSALCEEVVGTLRSSFLPPYDDRQSFSDYLIKYSNSFLDRMRTPWVREYFRMVIGESRIFPVESGALLLYLFSFGTETLSAQIARTDEKNALALAVICRSILGTFLLSRQIYSIGDGPFIDEEGLFSTLRQINSAAQEALKNA